MYYVYGGTYKEQVYITRANVKSEHHILARETGADWAVVYGQTSSKLDYNSNTVTITNSLSAAQAGNNDLSGTVRVAATGVA